MTAGAGGWLPGTVPAWQPAACVHAGRQYVGRSRGAQTQRGVPPAGSDGQVVGAGRDGSECNGVP